MQWPANMTFSSPLTRASAFSSGSISAPLHCSCSALHPIDFSDLLPLVPALLTVLAESGPGEVREIGG
jgi:hypothetical protein